MPEAAGYIAEIFAGIQGEGSWLGRRQLFLRLAGCSRHCAYCDTVWARSPRIRRWRLHVRVSGMRCRQFNPVSSRCAGRILATIWKQAGPFHSLSITGGEPLEQPEFLRSLSGDLRKRIKDIRIMLETNGLEFKPIKKLKGYFDFIAMDIKLKSVSGQASRFKAHRQFLQAVPGRQGCVKIVVGPRTTAGEIRRSARLSLELAPSWDLVLQPDSRCNWARQDNHAKLEALARAALEINAATRILPQMHKNLGWR